MVAGTVLGFWGVNRRLALTSCLLAHCRVPGMSIAPGGLACALGPRLARSCPPPGPPPRPTQQRQRPPRWRSRAPLVVTAAHRSGRVGPAGPSEDWRRRLGAGLRGRAGNPGREGAAPTPTV